MNKLVQKIICIALLISALSSCTQTINPSDLEGFYGVWANDSCELYFTQRFHILFLKDANAYSVDMKKINLTNNKLSLDTKAMFWFDTKTKKEIGKGLDLENNKERLFDSDKANDLDLESFRCQLQKKGGGVVLSYGGFTEKLVVGKLVLTLDDKSHQTLALVEKIKPTKEIDTREATKGNIGICMKEWLLGTQIKRVENYTTVNISTNRFNCHIGYGTYQKEGVFYARTATLGACNRGMIFRQNFRIMSSTVEHTAWCIDKHFEKLNSNLNVPYTAFDYPEFETTSDGTFWKLANYGTDWLKLQNNKGKKYMINRPSSTNKELIEYFTYELTKNDTTQIVKK